MKLGDGTNIFTSENMEDLIDFFGIGPLEKILYENEFGSIETNRYIFISCGYKMGTSRVCDEVFNEILPMLRMYVIKGIKNNNEL